MSETISDAELSEIDARATAATTGPWKRSTPETSDLTPRHDPMSQSRFVGFDLEQARGDCWIMTVHELVFDGFNEEEVGSTFSDLPVVVMAPGDAEFIAPARADVPRLIAEVRRLQAATREPAAESEEVGLCDSQVQKP